MPAAARLRAQLQAVQLTSGTSGGSSCAPSGAVARVSGGGTHPCRRCAGCTSADADDSAQPATGSMPRRCAGCTSADADDSAQPATGMLPRQKCSLRSGDREESQLSACRPPHGALWCWCTPGRAPESVLGAGVDRDASLAPGSPVLVPALTALPSVLMRRRLGRGGCASPGTGSGALLSSLATWSVLARAWALPLAQQRCLLQLLAPKP